jgi:hypothetical protein
MNFSFAEALAALGANTAVDIARDARPSANYLFGTILPERTSYDYHVDAAYMTVRTTMAGLVGMDAPFPPGGQITASTFSERTAKLAISVPLPEFALRQLQQMLKDLQIAGTPTVQTVQGEALNFLNKVIIQAHLDTMEYLRAQALVFGAINWTFNRKTLAVDYGIPAAHMLTDRTIVGNDAYGGTDSAFWADVREARRLLKGSIRAIIAHPDTIDEIVYNPANELRVIASEEGGSVSVHRFVGPNEILSPDARERVRIISYQEEGEIIDPADPSATLNVPFMPRGKVLFLGENRATGYRVGEGSTADPARALALGYTHIGPTVEAGGTPGRWARIYTPELRPWELRGEGVTNGLPVIEAPDKIVVATTELAP